MSLPRNVCFPGSNISLCVLSFSPYLLCNMSFFSLCDNISSSFLFIIWSNQCMVFQRKQSKGGVIQPVTAEIEPLEGTSPGLTTCRLFNLPCKVQRQPWCEVKDRVYIIASSVKTYKEFISLYAMELVSKINLIMRFLFFFFFFLSCWMCCPRSSMSLLSSLVYFLPRIMWCWTDSCTPGQTTPEF